MLVLSSTADTNRTIGEAMATDGASHVAREPAATSGATLISWAPAPEPTHQGILHRPGAAAQVAQLPRRPLARAEASMAIVARYWSAMGEYPGPDLPSAREEAPHSLPEVRPMRNPAGTTRPHDSRPFHPQLTQASNPSVWLQQQQLRTTPALLETVKAHFPGFALHSDAAATRHILLANSQPAWGGPICWWGYFLSKSG